jgi:phosphoribosylformylglycinamidine synthase
MGQKVEMLWHKDHSLKGCDFIVLPGGFSYGDYLRSGAISRFSPIMKEVIEFANNGGNVLGICNGFQILTEAHLLPGALLHNNNLQFICNNTFLKSGTSDSLLTSKIPDGKVLKIPIAHGEGNFYADKNVIDEIEANDQVIFRYCDVNGNVTESSNPNGSMNNIAGICNKERNVYGMMPHPERASDNIQGNEDGKLIFESILNLVNA